MGTRTARFLSGPTAHLRVRRAPSARKGAGPGTAAPCEGISSGFTVKALCRYR